MVSILKICRPLYKIVETEIILFLPNYSLQLENLGDYKIVSLKMNLLNWKLYVDFKYGLILKIRLQTSL